MNKLVANRDSYNGPDAVNHCASVLTHSRYSSLCQSDDTTCKWKVGAVFDACTATFRRIRDSSTIRTVANGGTTIC